MKITVPQNEVEEEEEETPHEVAASHLRPPSTNPDLRAFFDGTSPAVRSTIDDQGPSRPTSMGFKSMAAVVEGSDYFSVGSVVLCQTVHRQVEGEVVAFDQHTRMLVLKCPSSCGKASQFDIHMVNLNYCTCWSITKEATGSPPPLQPLNLPRLTTRVKANLDEKARLVNAMAAGVSPEGQRLFLVISKTFDEIAWQGETIVVMNRVTVAPPYRPDNCKGVNNDNRAAENQIRKIIEKHLKDQELQQQQDASVNSTGHTSPQTQA